MVAKIVPAFHPAVRGLVFVQIFLAVGIGLRAVELFFGSDILLHGVVRYGGRFPYEK